MLTAARGFQLKTATAKWEKRTLGFSRQLSNGLEIKGVSLGFRV